MLSLELLTFKPWNLTLDPQRLILEQQAHFGKMKGSQGSNEALK
jgi:hypothetical protein